MFAQVIDGTITSFPKGNKGIQIGDLKYPKAIYSLWTEAERNAIGIYTVIIDNTNLKTRHSILTQTKLIHLIQCRYSYSTYGTATAKAIADTTWSQQDSDDEFNAK
jgi:hypothetical protein